MERRHDIHELFRKYLAGEHTPDELNEILAYFQLAEHAEYLEDMIVRELNQIPDTDSALMESMVANVDRRLADKLYKPPTPLRKWLTYAAAIIAVSTTAIYLWRAFSPIPTVTITASRSAIREVALPDSSRVWLNRGASISYPATFAGNNRKVMLTNGQAYFSIKGDVNKPFVVAANSLVVEVLGTAFEITTFDRSEISTVSVSSGKVNVSSIHPGDGQAKASVLSANQKATVNSHTGQINTTIINGDDIAGWKENRLIFAADDFANVIEALQRRYQVAFDIQNPKLYNEKITLRLDNQPLQTVLQVLTLNNLFKYQFANDSTVVIY